MASDQHSVLIVGEPNWKPLERIFRPHECADYMYMGRVGEIELYKHRLTRRYLNIDADGRFYLYASRRHMEVTRSTALEHLHS
jgi:hypothetical protein